MTESELFSSPPIGCATAKPLCRPLRIPTAITAEENAEGQAFDRLAEALKERLLKIWVDKPVVSQLKPERQPASYSHVPN